MEVGDSHDSNMATSKLIGRRQEWTNQTNYISVESWHVGSWLEISVFYIEFELYAGKYRSVTIPYYLSMWQWIAQFCYLPKDRSEH